MTEKKTLLFPLGGASPDRPCEQTAYDENTTWPAWLRHELMIISASKQKGDEN